MFRSGLPSPGGQVRTEAFAPLPRTVQREVDEEAAGLATLYA